MVNSLTYMFQEDLYYFSSSVVVVLRRPWGSYSPEEQKLLQKILTSVKVDIDAVQMVAQPSIELKTLVTFSPGRVLVFGSDIPGEIVPYQETTAHGFRVIRADDLSELTDEKKKNLWTALRQMFGV